MKDMNLYVIVYANVCCYGAVLPLYLWIPFLVFRLCANIVSYHLTEYLPVRIYEYKISTRKFGIVHRIYSYRNKKDTCVAYFDMMYYKNNTGAYLSSIYNNVGLPLYNKPPWPPLATVVSNLISQHIKCVYQHRNAICAICH